MASSLLYSNSRVKCLENNLIGLERLQRLASSDDIHDAIKILQEVGYGDGAVIDNPNHYEKLLDAENKHATKFYKDAMPDKMGLESFLFEIDAQNIKAFVKIKYGSKTSEGAMIKTEGYFAIDKIKEAINNDDYKIFPKNIAKALFEIDSYFVANDKQARIIDEMIDKALYLDIFDLFSIRTNKSLIKYFKSVIDFRNFESFIRHRRSKLSLREFENSFIENGNITKSFLVRNYEQAYEGLRDQLQYSNAGSILAFAIDEINEKKVLIEYERNKESYLINIFEKDKNDIFSIAPIARYYLLKKIEIKMVRLALVCIKNKVSIDEFKLRLREIF